MSAATENGSIHGSLEGSNTVVKGDDPKGGERLKIVIDTAAVIAGELSLGRAQVQATLDLFGGGATLPFIARYRKEATGNLDEVQIGHIQERAAYLGELVARKETVLASIAEQGKLTDTLSQRIRATLSKTELEDLYLPYRPKRKTRASQARERGLQPLADRILLQERNLPGTEVLAAPFVDAAKGVADVEAAFAGARDIVAETIAETALLRALLRTQALETGSFASRAVKGKELEGAKFKDYFEFEEPAKTLPSHRILALRRGEKEGFLHATLEVDVAAAEGAIRHEMVRDPKASLAAELEAAIGDAYERLLQPAIEVDVRLALKDRADTEAIKVFAENLRHLLLAPPLGGKRVLAVDPGYRTGCKLAVLDDTGNLGSHDVIYPSQSEARVAEAESKVVSLCAKNRIEAIAIGNGTAGRETETFIRKLVREGRLDVGGKSPVVVLVNESGASVYSASEVAREELPDQDITVRGAVSIGRRLQDPLAELVKIDPKAIGVGQYQHDVHQPTLEKALDGVVESCVNAVGVDVNTASVRLLRYVAGVGETLAKNIVTHRAANGPFGKRAALREVPRLGPKAFEQAAGFLRVRSGHPLDNTAVHPESYDIVERMAKDLGVEVAQLAGSAQLVSKIEIARYVDEKRGEPTLRDILEELKKPGRDPRAQFETVSFREDVTEFSHLKDGMVLDGVVTNVTRFGAFVDVGVHHDGLVHISELSHRFVKDPSEVVKVGDRVKVKVVQLDAERKRVGLSIKQATEPPKGTQGTQSTQAGQGAQRTQAGQGAQRTQAGQANRPQKPTAPAGNRPPQNPGGGGGGSGLNTPFNSIRFKR